MLRLTRFSKVLFIFLLVLGLAVLSKPFWKKLIPSKGLEYTNFIDETASFITDRVNKGETIVISLFKPYNDEKKGFGNLMSEDIYMKLITTDSTKRIVLDNNDNVQDSFSSPLLLQPSSDSLLNRVCYVVSGQYAIVESSLKVWVKISEHKSGNLISKKESMIIFDSEIRNLVE